MRPLHLVLLLGMNVLWAGSYSLFKALAPHLTAGDIATYRIGLAAIALGAAWPWIPGRAPQGRDFWRTAAMGIVVFVLSPRLQILGVQLGKAGDASVVIALEPLVTAVAAALFLHEHLPARRWIGFAVGMLGVALLNGGWRFQMDGALLWANLIFIASFFCESAFSVIGKPLLERASPLKMIGCALLCATALNLVLDGRSALSKVPSLHVNDWLGLLFLAWVCTVAGYSLWFHVIRQADVSLAALTILVQPACGVAIAAFLLKEPLHWGQLWGTLAILVGLAVGTQLRETSAQSLTESTPVQAPKARS